MERGFSPSEYMKQKSNISTACRVVTVPLTDSSLFPATNSKQRKVTIGHEATSLSTNKTQSTLPNRWAKQV